MKIRRFMASGHPGGHAPGPRRARARRRHPRDPAQSRPASSSPPRSTTSRQRRAVPALRAAAATTGRQSRSMPPTDGPAVRIDQGSQSTAAGTSRPARRTAATDQRIRRRCARKSARLRACSKRSWARLTWNDNVRRNAAATATMRNFAHLGIDPGRRADSHRRALAPDHPDRRWSAPPAQLVEQHAGLRRRPDRRRRRVRRHRADRASARPRRSPSSRRATRSRPAGGHRASSPRTPSASAPGSSWRPSARSSARPSTRPADSPAPRRDPGHARRPQAGAGRHGGHGPARRAARPAAVLARRGRQRRQGPARASGQHADLRHCRKLWTRSWRPAQSACILTKTDEATSLGGALSALIRSGLPLAYVANGQRVPEDLHFAQARQTWLVKSRVELMSRAGRDSTRISWRSTSPR